MGVCASSQYRRKDGVPLNWPSTAMVIHQDAKVQEFSHPIKAGNILSQNPNCFLCSSESLHINSHMPIMPQSEELQLGQIYFLMPLSKSQAPLSLKDLGALAIKAHAALAHSHGRSQIVTIKPGYSSMKSSTPKIKPSPDLTSLAWIPQGGEATKQVSCRSNKVCK